jgi:hypothetical protein
MLMPFLLLGVSPFAYIHFADGTNQGDGAAEFGSSLTESAQFLKIKFIHEGPEFDPIIKNVMPWMASLGASAAIADINNDGWPDVYVTNSRIGSKNRLYLNRGGGTFEEVAEKAGVADVNRQDTGVSMGAAWGDCDNNGYEDLLLFKWGYLELFRNDGDGTFARVTREAGLGDWIYANDAIWWDFNRDGCLDIYVAAYFRPEHNLWHLDTTRILHNDFERSQNAGRNKLYENQCNGTFKEVSQRYGLDDPGWSLSVGAADLDGNGWSDLYVANDFGPDSLFLNRDGSHFKRLIDRHGIGDDTKKGMNVAFGDFNNSGRLSIYVTNITKRGFLLEGNMLWENLGHGQFREVAWQVGAADGGWGWGGQFGDLNNDGHLDIYTVNGFISADRKTEYWYELGTMATSASFIVEDAKNWPPIGNRSLSGHEHSRIFLNDGKGRFREVAQAVGSRDTHDGRAVSLADLDNNGSLDVVVANQRGPLLVYLNRVDPGRKWIQFWLRGTKTNRSAIGSRVTLYWDDQRQVQEVDGGSGFAGHSDKRLHFGLGENPTIHRAEIRWLSGKVQVLTSLEPNRLYSIEEP